MNFVNNDGKSPPKPKEPEWSDIPTDVVHLTEESFDNTASQVHDKFCPLRKSFKAQLLLEKCS